MNRSYRRNFDDQKGAARPEIAHRSPPELSIPSCLTTNPHGLKGPFPARNVPWCDTCGEGNNSASVVRSSETVASISLGQAWPRYLDPQGAPARRPSAARAITSPRELDNPNRGRLTWRLGEFCVRKPAPKTEDLQICPTRTAAAKPGMHILAPSFSRITRRARSLPTPISDRSESPTLPRGARHGLGSNPSGGAQPDRGSR